MEQFSARIQTIRSKTSRLVSKMSQMNSQNLILSADNDALKKQLDEQKNLVTELNDKIKMLKLAKTIGGEDVSSEKTELKRKINEYIKEIDKCIGLLND